MRPARAADVHVELRRAAIGGADLRLLAGPRASRPAGSPCPHRPRGPSPVTSGWAAPEATASRTTTQRSGSTGSASCRRVASPGACGSSTSVPRPSAAGTDHSRCTPGGRGAPGSSSATGASSCLPSRNGRVSIGSVSLLPARTTSAWQVDGHEQARLADEEAVVVVQVRGDAAELAERGPARGQGGLADVVGVEVASLPAPVVASWKRSVSTSIFTVATKASASWCDGGVAEDLAQREAQHLHGELRRRHRGVHVGSGHREQRLVELLHVDDAGRAGAEGDRDGAGPCRRP